MDNPKLNTAQIEAVKHDKGPLLIIAGAGTGKTTVISQRIMHFVVERNISPDQILALTFTDKAAREMEERIDRALPLGYTQMWITTFHAFCDRVLRADGIHIGLNPAYKLVTESEAIMFMRKNIFKFELEYFRPLGNPTKFLEGMLQHFSRLRDEDINPAEYMLYSKKLSKIKDLDKDEIKKTFELANAFKIYEDLKVQEGIEDFSNLISHTLELFRTRKNVLQQYQKQFKYIMIDEFQDTNFAQNELALLLTSTEQNITAVGDDDQAIYRWRGAALSNMLHFKEHFPKAKIIALTENYRSTSSILNTAYSVIQNNNPDRLEIKENISKKLTAVVLGSGDPVQFLFGNRADDEAEQVAKKITELTKGKKDKRYKFADIAILVRANDHAQSFVRAFERMGIPYQYLGPGQLFRQPEIKDLIAYLKVLTNLDDSTSLYRVLSMPIFMIDASDIAKMLNFAKRKNYTLSEVMDKIDELPLINSVKERVKAISAMIQKHLSLVKTESAGQIMYYFLQDSSLIKTFTQAITSEQEKIINNITLFFDRLKSFEGEHEDASVFAVNDWIDLSMQMGESPLSSSSDWIDNNGVSILTMHASKGLEFPVVFLVNLVSQRFPSRERREQIPLPSELLKERLPESDYHLQEERRLFYVGITRAKEKLFLTAANFYGEGKRESKLSPFIYEAIQKEIIEAVITKKVSKKNADQLMLFGWGSTKEQTLDIGEVEPVILPYTNHSITPITYISYSQIQTYQMCPLHYKLRYIVKVPTPQAPAPSFGTSIHEALRQFYGQIINGVNISPDDIYPILEKVWIREGYGGKDHERAAFAQAKLVLKKYMEHNFTRENVPIALETPFMFPLNGIKVGGRVDRIDKTKDGKIEIIDYKTGSNIPSEKDLISNMQLTIYALAATEIQDKLFNRKPEEVILTLHYLESNTKLTTSRTVDQLEEAKVNIVKKAEEIGRSDFICSKAIFCKTCEYSMLCSTLVN